MMEAIRWKQTRKDSGNLIKLSPRAARPTLFTEKDLTLLLMTVITAITTALRSNKEMEKAVKAAMTAMTQTVTEFREQSSKAFAPTPTQGETLLPTPSQGETCFPTCSQGPLTPKGEESKTNESEGQAGFLHLPGDPHIALPTAPPVMMTATSHVRKTL